MTPAMLHLAFTPLLIAALGATAGLPSSAGGTAGQADGIAHGLFLAATTPTAGGEQAKNAVFDELTGKGVMMSDGKAVRLPRPIIADGLTAVEHQSAIAAAPKARYAVKALLDKSAYAPVEIKIRTVRTLKEDGPTVRAIDAWFVAHGDWDVLCSKEFLDSVTGRDEGKSRIVSRSGVLDEKQLAKRGLKVAADGGGCRRQFVYTTFSLFDRVELSATRFSTSCQGKESILAAGQIDRRFDRDKEFPNQWRLLERDAQAEIHRGPAHPFRHAGGYAKITRLHEPADAVFVECHLVYEEDYGWFDGANLVKQKVPLMIQEKVRTFRRKLAVASEKP